MNENNIVHISDPHLGTGYKTRSGVFYKDQYKKMRWILNFCKKRDAILTIGGDVFDSSREGQYEIVTLYIQLFRRSKVPIIFIAGQHDLRYHRMDTYPKTPLRVVEIACPNCKLAGNSPIVFGNFHIYGASWKEEYPTPLDDSKTNVLLLHETINRIFAGQEETKYTNGRALLRSLDFDLILAGDNHKTFTIVDKKTGHSLINPGSVMRLKADQAEFKPSLFLIHGTLHKFKQFNIPVPDIEFTKKEIVAEEFDDTFIQELKKTKLKKQDFLSFLLENKPEEIEDEVESIVRRLQ